MDMLSAVSKITAKSIERYLGFYGFDGLMVEEQDEISEMLRKAIPAGDRETVGKKLVLSKKAGDTVVTPRQFLYDIEVFYNIYAELDALITFERFACFVKEMMEKCEKTGWQLVFSDKNFITEKLCRNGVSVNVVSDDCCHEKTILVLNGKNEISGFYEKHKSTCRIVSHFFLELVREWIMVETCSFFKKSLEERGVSLYLVNWEWAQNNLLYPKKEITSEDVDCRKKFSIYNITNNEKNYSEFLHELYGDYTEEYITGIYDIPVKVELGKGKVRHVDKKSRYVNVISGERLTNGQPADYSNSVYMLGGCVFFGYAIDDASTIASSLQTLLNERCTEKKWRVCNYATWGGNIDQTYATLFDFSFRKGDIVLISYAGILPVGDFDISTGLGQVYSGKNFYYDTVLHCNAQGYEKIAGNILELLREDFCVEESCDKAEFVLQNTDEDLKAPEKLKEYIEETKEMIPKEILDAKKVGAIVMNCNPFTLGHRYLIEYASQKVDGLIIFVVEEDKSFFPFADRIALVKEGTKDMKNVAVVPSGSFIISTVTFPGYFMKENPKEAIIDSSQDVEMFAKNIASAFHIGIRFVGEEPLDVVTKHYNDTLKEILPKYGIMLEEIPRKTQDADVISASRVRKYLQEKNMDAISELVPETTLRYLTEKYM